MRSCPAGRFPLTETISPEIAALEPQAGKLSLEASQATIESFGLRVPGEFCPDFGAGRDGCGATGAGLHKRKPLARQRPGKGHGLDPLQLDRKMSTFEICCSICFDPIEVTRSCEKS